LSRDGAVQQAWCLDTCIRQERKARFGELFLCTRQFRSRNLKLFIVVSMAAQELLRKRILVSKPAGYSQAMSVPRKYPVTPDGRYFVVAGRLWRMSNPRLDEELRRSLVERLMAARRLVAVAKKASDVEAERSARAAVDETKRQLGERGPVWWTDGAPDFNRRMAVNTPYAAWYAALAPDASC
jgi:hypothetical protein